MKRQITTGLRTWLPVLLLASGLTGCAATGIQQPSGSDPGESSKIVLADRTGNVDGHKRAFATEYIVAPGTHTVGVCNAGLCEKYYYVRFDTKPGYTYTVQEQQANVSVTNRQGYVIDTQGYGLDLRDGVPAVLSFRDEAGHGN